MLTRPASGVFVVMSTYNGERYVSAQIESLFAQTYRDWRLLIRDDGSTDRTRETVSRFAERDGRINPLEADGARLGPWASFGVLLDKAYEAGAAYVFMCDQDDVWEADKIELELRALKSAEAEVGTGLPLMVHTDLRVVDSSLSEINASYRRYQGVSYDRGDPLRTLILHNAVLGCTVAANRSLLALALPLPAGADHDWWLAQCAAAAGKLIDIPQATVRYRHHGGNTTGAPGRRAAVMQLLRSPLTFVSSFMPRFAAGVAQAEALHNRIIERAPGSLQEERIAAYTSSFHSQTGYFRRLAAFWKSGVRPQRKGSYIFLPIILGIFPRWRRQPERSEHPATSGHPSTI